MRRPLNAYTNRLPVTVQIAPSYRSARRDAGPGGLAGQAPEIGAPEFGADVAVAAALDLVVGEMAPLVATFVTVDAGYAARFRAARGSHLPADELAREARSWHRQTASIGPLAPAALAGLPGAIATFADVGGARAVQGNAALMAAYRRIGVIDDVRVLIRDGLRLRAAIALWRPLRSRPWSRSQLRLLRSLQPLIEMGCLALARAAPRPLDEMLPAELTPRQRDVARLLAAGANNREVSRALNISPNTVKSHTRAVLAKLGAGSQREMVLLLREGGLDSARRG